MDNLLIIILALAWAAVSIAGNKKKQKAKQEAERARQQTAQAGRAVAPAQPARQPVQKPRAETPDGETFDPYFSGDAAAPAPVRKAEPARHISADHRQPKQSRNAAAPDARVRQTLASQLTELHETSRESRHTLEASSITGHAHQETSLTGVESECPPEPQRQTASVQSASVPAAVGAFAWNQSAVLNGVVMSEILGKPKALRR